MELLGGVVAQVRNLGAIEGNNPSLGGNHAQYCTERTHRCTDTAVFQRIKRDLEV